MPVNMKTKDAARCAFKSPHLLLKKEKKEKRENKTKKSKNKTGLTLLRAEGS